MIDGKKAEELVENFLKKNKFKIVGKNVWIKKFGEIDIIAKKKNIYYFIEVKSLNANDAFDPSLHYDQKKRKKIHSLVSYYTNKNNIENFSIWLATVIFDKENFEINIYENV